jgi:AcrR family transcriptional regulator
VLSPTESSPPRRRYDGTIRRERAAATRERIVAAGAELALGFASWDWGGLTFRAVAEAAGVSERTVYRNFPTELMLRDAVMSRLEDDAGVTYADLQLDDVATVATKVFAAMSRFTGMVESPRCAVDPTAVSAGERRKEALLNAVSTRAPQWSDDQCRSVAGLIDILWLPPTHERLMRVWDLDADEASRAIEWLIDAVVAAAKEGRAPI